MAVYSHLIITSIVATLILAQSPFDIHIPKIYCASLDKEAMQNVSCSLKAVNRSTTLITSVGNITRKIYTLFSNVQVLRKSEVTYRPYLVNITDNLCEFYGKNKGSYYARMAIKIYKSYTNLYHPCPFYGYHYIKDLPIDVDKLPAIWPFGNYLLDIVWREQNFNKLHTMKLYFEVKQRRRS